MNCTYLYVAGTRTRSRSVANIKNGVYLTERLYYIFIIIIIRYIYDSMIRVKSVFSRSTVSPSETGVGIYYDTRGVLRCKSNCTVFVCIKICLFISAKTRKIINYAQDEMTIYVTNLYLQVPRYILHNRYRYWKN